MIKLMDFIAITISAVIAIAGVEFDNLRLFAIGFSMFILMLFYLNDNAHLRSNVQPGGEDE